MTEFAAALATLLITTITGFLYSRLLKREKPHSVNVTHNLPAQSSQLFVGRENELSILRDFLSPTNQKTMAGVFGMGGIGKTSLLIRIGQECVSRKMFDLILYIPARRFSPSNDNDTNNIIMDTIISTAVYALDSQQSKLTNSEKEAFVRASFSQKRTLLLVDGLDETGEKEQNELVNFLLSLPSQTKIIISSRRQIDLPLSIQLSVLTLNEYRTLLNKGLASTNTKELSDDVVEKLYDLTGGLPLAVRMTISLIRNYSIDTVLNKVTQESNNLYEFVIEPVISKYWNKHPYKKLLITLAHLSDLATLPEIAYKAGLADEIQLVEEGLVGLTQVSLLTKTNDKYIMHPLTKEYILGKEKSEH